MNKNKMNKNTKIDTIIFDLDGTLLDTLTDLTNSVNYVMEAFSLPAHTKEQVRQMVGNGIYVLFEKAIPGGRSYPQFDQCVRLFQEHYEAHKKDFTKPFPGILDFLKEAYENGYHLAVVSNKFDLAVKGLCEDFFAPYITTAIGESAKIARKPAPDTVFEAMKELGVSPGTCVYVGDSDVDLATARNAGIPCISVAWGFRDEAFLTAQGASHIARTAKELAMLLKEL